MKMLKSGPFFSESEGEHTIFGMSKLSIHNTNHICEGVILQRMLIGGQSSAAACFVSVKLQNVTLLHVCVQLLHLADGGLFQSLFMSVSLFLKVQHLLSEDMWNLANSSGSWSCHDRKEEPEISQVRDQNAL